MAEQETTWSRDRWVELVSTLLAAADEPGVTAEDREALIRGGRAAARMALEGFGG